MTKPYCYIQAEFDRSGLKSNPLPSISLLNSTYRKLCKSAHPDKGGTEKQFIRLTELWKKLGAYIAEHKEPETAEESDQMQMFKQFNIIKQNSRCITIKLGKGREKYWSQALIERYGVPSKLQHNGQQWSVKTPISDDL